MKTAIKLLSPAALAMLLVVPINQVSATELASSTKLRLKTSVTEVNGVREIENGNFEKGIRKSLASLNKSSATPLRKSLLDNLCVAHIALNDLQQAEQYCNSAVSLGKPSAISYNNRAVMYFVLGDMQASLEDIDAANELASFKTIVKHNGAIINQQKFLTNN
jgi:tetratricopeptide (TPR) repeat protein